MNLQLFLLFTLCSIMLSSGFFIAISQNAMYVLLCLIVNFLSAATIWVMLDAEFLGLLLIVIYVGAVMVLFLFVVMMISPSSHIYKNNYFLKNISAYIVSIILLAFLLELVLTLYQGQFASGTYTEERLSGISLENLGLIIYSEYDLAIILVGLILLAAIISSVSILIRSKNSLDFTSDAASVEASDRLKLIKLDREPY